MKTTIIPSRWLGDTGRRLDPGPYLSGAIEAKEVLRLLKVKKERLIDLTSGHDGGIFNGPQFSRNYVDSPAYGVPFLGSSSMLLADLSHVPLLRRKDAESNKLKHLRLEVGMTLISCSGTIGRMVYTRPDMAGKWSSQHVMKVAPDPEKIPPGYLYPFLSSRFGVPMVTSSTYGAIIQHIEPEHLHELPVPMLSEDVMVQTHELVRKAAELRSAARVRLAKARSMICSELGISPLRPRYSYQAPDSFHVRSGLLRSRMDAEHFASWNADAATQIASALAAVSKPLREIAEVFIPDIFKRRFAGSAEFGVPYHTGKDVYMLEPKADKFLVSRLAMTGKLIIRKGMIVVQDSGQVGGLIGRATLVGKSLDNTSCTNNMVRISAHDSDDVGFLYAFLASDTGYRLVIRQAAGSSIPHLEQNRIGALRIPWPSREIRLRFNAIVAEALHEQSVADEYSQEATSLVEDSMMETC